MPAASRPHFIAWGDTVLIAWLEVLQGKTATLQLRAAVDDSDGGPLVYALEELSVELDMPPLSHWVYLIPSPNGLALLFAFEVQDPLGIPRVRIARAQCN